jgi:hypothetical protein
MAELATQVAHAQRHSTAFAEILRGVDAQAVNSRAALARLPVTRKTELLERQKASRASDPFGGFSTPAPRPGHGARLRLARPDLRTRGRHARLLARRARLYAAGFRSRRAGAQRLQLPHDPGRLHPGVRRARRGLHGVPGRHRPDRAAAAGHHRTPARGLHRHAQLPAHPGREGPGRGPTSPACARPWWAAKPCRPACATGSPSAAWRSTRATPPPTWAWWPTRRARARAWWWTRA